KIDASGESFAITSGPQFFSQYPVQHLSVTPAGLPESDIGYVVATNDSIKSNIVTVCIHGNPTSKFLYRNIIPYISEACNTVIAPDLMAMGDSPIPKGVTDFSLDIHYAYIREFLDTIVPSDKKIVLVVQDWGSGIGFRYAHERSERIAGLVFFEAILEEFAFADVPLANKIIFRLFRGLLGSFINQRLNFFIKYFLGSAGSIRKPTSSEMQEYLRPYPTYDSLKVVAQWPCEIPFADHSLETGDRNRDKIVATGEYIFETNAFPKVFLHASPGAIIDEAKKDRYIAKLGDTAVAVDLGKGLHYLQEDHPAAIGMAVSALLQQL
ncbi:MAG: alpha/beta fold hydrolase, partial [Saprospiraceae bacterium]|nr:alpha/beta fold hydrolase [Saprospiraceae bacterium]